MDVGPVRSLREWAHAIAAMPVGPLPSRVVLVPRLRIAHALKRELAQLNPSALLGTVFLTPVLAAKEVLAVAGHSLRTGEESLRAVRLQQRFEAGLSLKHFELEQLRNATGWARAFVRTIGELEGAGLEPDRLRTHGDPRLDDVAQLWDSLARSGGDSLTSDAVLVHAARLLRQGSAWPWTGHTLAVVSGHESGVQAAFLHSVPRLVLRALEVRPLAGAFVKRRRALFPSLTSDSTPAPVAASELSVLQRYLFEDPQVLASSARPRSPGRDGTVELEEYAGVESEVEAAAEWVVRQVRAGVPLAGLAILVPHAEPLTSWVRARLERIPWPDGPFPVFVAGGESALSTGAGTRMLSLLRALSAWLPAEALTELLPSLQTTDGERVVPDDAVELASGLGTLGGSAGRPRGALEWFPAAAAAKARLSTRIAELAARPEGEDDDEAEARRLWQLERQEEALVRVLPAMEGLHRIAELLCDDAPLQPLWASFRDFLFTKKHLRIPPDGIEVLHVLDAAVQRAAADPGLAEVRGQAALLLIEETLGRLRRMVGRFGEPRVYVGTVRSAVGLGFDAVRFIGLAEGTIPPSLREDAVLDSSLKDRLGAPALVTREQRSLAELHAVFRVVAEARRHVTFSFPRADVSGSSHEASSLFIEVAAALGRPNALTGAPGPAVPRASELARDAYQPARVAHRTGRFEHPVVESAWLERSAALRKDVPAHWVAPGVTNPFEAHAIASEARGGLRGYLNDPDELLELRGLSREHPISASRLKTLLECPHRFFLESVLHWDGPAEAPAPGGIEPLTYGTLVHRVLERFGRSAGASLRNATKRDARAEVESIAHEEFDVLMKRYALLGEEVRAAERRRLLRDVGTFFEAEWAGREEREFVAVERGFGVGGALEMKVNGESLFVHGFIDRLDKAGSSLLVRDYKTGKPHPRSGAEAGPTPELDAQIALYGLVARRLAKEWKTPKTVEVAYAYPSDHEPLRHFSGDDADTILEAGERWLALSHALLSSRTFPRRPTVERCGFCAFNAVCGASGPSESEALLKDPDSDVERLLAEHWNLTGDEESDE
jgi:RecB family exonuclease